MIIGHGEHRPALEALSRELDVANDVIWAGYHETISRSTTVRRPPALHRARLGRRSRAVLKPWPWRTGGNDADRWRRPLVPREWLAAMIEALASTAAALLAESSDRCLQAVAEFARPRPRASSAGYAASRSRAKSRSQLVLQRCAIRLATARASRFVHAPRRC
jgi:hypothetical protein